MGKVQEQKKEIYKLLTESGNLTLSHAMQVLGVSESTVRRLFSGLEADGLAIRRYGGLQLLETQASKQYSFNLEKEQNVEKKQLIAKYAVSFVKNGDAIYIDSGTTLCHFAMFLSERLKNEGDLNNVTIVTNSFTNINTFRHHQDLILIGGKYREHRNDFCGYVAEESLKLLRFTKCFLGCDGYSPSFGFSTTDFFTARLNEIVLKNSAASYVLMDSSKYNRTATISYSKNRVIGTLITDSLPPADVAKQLSSDKTEIIICK